MGGELIFGIVLVVVGIGGLVVQQSLLRSKGSSGWLTAVGLGSAGLIMVGAVFLLIGILG